MRDLIKSRGYTCDWMFKDTPYRVGVANFKWAAELSIVGQDTGGNWQVLQTMQWGFKVVDFKVFPTDINLNYPTSSFSKVHLSTINTLLRGK